MIQQQTYVDIADNTGAKVAMCIKVLRGSSSKGKFKRKVANIGDIIICAVKKSIPAGEIKQGEIIRCVVVRTKQPTLPPRWQLRALRPQRRRGDRQGKQSARHAHLRRRGPRTARQELHEDRLAGKRSGVMR